MRRNLILKKFIAAMSFIFTLLIATICSAGPVDNSEVSLGGIPYQAPESYVKSIYGSPTSNRTEYVDNEVHRGYITTWKYGDSLSIDFIDDHVSFITATANNGFATPAGAYVGMKESILQRLYGAPRKHHTWQDGSSFEYYRSEMDDYIGIRFDCQNGIVKSIRAGLFDD